MNSEEVQTIVLATIRELKRQGLLRDPYGAVLKDIEPDLKGYFKNKKNKKIGRFFIDFSDDPYIDVLYLHYRDGLTMERIAEVMSKDVSTIKRNKKRLMMELYDRMEV